MVSKNDIIERASKSFNPNKTKDLLNDLEDKGFLRQEGDDVSLTTAGEILKLNAHRSMKKGDRSSNIDLYNEVLSGLAVPKRSMHSYRQSKRGDFAIRSFRNDMAKAERMKLSDNFVAHAVALSFSYPKYFSKLIERAIPAFDTLWIEWDELKRFDCIQENFEKTGIPVDDNRDSVANRLGYLIRNNGNGCFEYSLVMCDPLDGTSNVTKITGPMCSFLFSNDPDEPVLLKSSKFQVGEDSFMSDRENEDTRANFMGALMGRAYINNNDAAPDEFLKWTPNLQVNPHDFFACQDMRPVMQNPEIIRKMLSLSCHAMEGDLRFLIAVFSLLNYPRFVREVSSSPKKVSSVRWGRVVPKSEVKVIEIELPKRGVNVYEQLFTGSGSPKRQHVRRGHWRVYKDTFGRVKERKWINPMVCGDPELGVIDHEYILKVKRDKNNG